MITISFFQICNHSSWNPHLLAHYRSPLLHRLWVTIPHCVMHHRNLPSRFRIHSVRIEGVVSKSYMTPTLIKNLEDTVSLLFGILRLSDHNCTLHLCHELLPSPITFSCFTKLKKLSSPQSNIGVRLLLFDTQRRSSANIPHFPL